MGDLPRRTETVCFPRWNVFILPYISSALWRCLGDKKGTQLVKMLQQFQKFFPWGPGLSCSNSWKRRPFKQKNIRMYYGSGNGGRRCVCTGHTLHVLSPDGSTFLRKMTSWPPKWTYDVQSKIQLGPSIDANLQDKQSYKFHPDPIWNDGVLGFFWTGQQEQQQQQQQVAIWSQFLTSNLLSVWTTVSTFALSYFINSFYCVLLLWLLS